MLLLGSAKVLFRVCLFESGFYVKHCVASKNAELGLHRIRDKEQLHPNTRPANLVPDPYVNCPP